MPTYLEIFQKRKFSQNLEKTLVFPYKTSVFEKILNNVVFGEFLNKWAHSRSAQVQSRLG